MCHVVASIAKDSSTVGCSSCIPVPEDDSMCKLPERGSKRNEERRWHDEPILVHREVVVNAVQQEVQGDTDTVVWQIPTVMLAVNSVIMLATRTHPNGTSTYVRRIR